RGAGGGGGRIQWAARSPESAVFLRGLGGPGATAASAGIAGHLIAHAVIAIITGAPALPTNCIYGINLVAPDDQTMVRHPRLPGCPGCGAQANALSPPCWPCFPPLASGAPLRRRLAPPSPPASGPRGTTPRNSPKIAAV